MKDYLDITCVGMAYADKAEANAALLAAIEEHGLDSPEVAAGFFIAVEPDNEFDANAIAIGWVPGGVSCALWELHSPLGEFDKDVIVGYVPKDGQRELLDWFSGQDDVGEESSLLEWAVTGVQWTDPSETKIKWLELQITF
jgi:hypothetical protein